MRHSRIIKPNHLSVWDNEEWIIGGCGWSYYEIFFFSHNFRAPLFLYGPPFGSKSDLIGGERGRAGVLATTVSSSFLSQRNGRPILE